MTKSWGEYLWDYRKSLGISRKKFAEQLDINEGTLRSYETEARKPGYVMFNKINDYIKNNPTVNNKQGDEKGEEYMNDLIRTKDRLIESLENEKRLMAQIIENQKLKQVEPTDAYHMDLADATLHFTLKMNWNGKMSVCYLDSGENVKRFGEKLGYTKDEMYDILMIGQMVDYGKHNIHRLRSEEQKQQMLETLKNYIKTLSLVKMTTSSITAEVPVPYTKKDGTPKAASCEYTINWVEGSGVCKIRFMV
jgi:transcriptional regulator with XRE-family HTH domain